MNRAAHPAQLLLWRHAQAEEGGVDAARALTRRGQKQAARLAGWLAAQLPAEYRLLVSPAVRAQQTASALQSEFATLDDLAVDCSAPAALAAAGWPGCGGTTIIVGHQPTLGRIAALLLCGREQAWTLRKGALWWLQLRDERAAVSVRAVVDPDFL